MKQSNHQQLQEQHQQQLQNSSHEEVRNSKKHFLLLPYKGRRAENIIKSMKKTIHKLLPEHLNTQIAYTGRNSAPVFKLKIKANLITSMTWCIMQNILVSYVTNII